MPLPAVHAWQRRGAPLAGAHTCMKRVCDEAASGIDCGCRHRSTYPPLVPHTLGVDSRALRWIGPPAGPAIVLLDQTRLPAEGTYLTCRDIPALTDAIRRLVVRGAPLLGVAGAYGVALAAFRG